MRGFGWFVAWIGVGAAYAMVPAGAFTVGIFFVPVALAATVVLALVRRSHVGLPGLLAGPGLLLGYLAYLNRGGPGDVCVPLPGDGQSCTQEYSPYPFLAAALLFIVAGTALFAARRRARPAGDRSGG